MKSGPQIETFTPNGLKFDDGSELPADIVIFATGYEYSSSHRDVHLTLHLPRIGSVRHAIRRVCGEELTSRVKPIWGLDEEGELKGCYRDLGPKGLFAMMGAFSRPRSPCNAAHKVTGNLALCRFHSKHVALREQARFISLIDPDHSSQRSRPWRRASSVSGIRWMQRLRRTFFTKLPLYQL